MTLREGALNGQQRTVDLAALRDGPPLDVLVIGGGVVGTGAALDAASRGMRVGLVERRDLAWGTSRWSSKLVHGGLRYLARGEVGIAIDSARERAILLQRTAPHLVRPLPEVVALTPAVNRQLSWQMRAGFALGDGLRRAAGTPRALLGRARRISPEDVQRLLPEVRRAGLRGGLLLWDAQLEDDARLVVALARTAAAHGARIVTRCAAIEIGAGGARVRDELGDTMFDVAARSVINATGVWAGELAAGLSLRPSRGSHIVVRLSRLGKPTAMQNVPVPGGEQRWVFAIPQRTGVAYVGLTDEPENGPVGAVPHVPDPDVVFLLEALSAALEQPLCRNDVIGAFAGLRPLAGADGDGPTADLSRRHVLVPGERGVVSVTGGKLTTYRRIAEDAVDAAVAAGGLRSRPCRTRAIPLLGAAPRSTLTAIAAPRRVIDRHGTEAGAVLAHAGGDPTLLEPVAPGVDILGVEILHALRVEGALTVDDILDRRTRIGLVPADRAAAAAAIEALVGAERQAAAL
jgi:glycerol-3-phosphate dehydrogenase